MTITQIEPVTKAKSRVHASEGPLFILYNRELLRYQIQEGSELPDETYRMILTDVLAKRAKQRVMYLLKGMDRTERQLRQKLKEGGYPEEIIEEAITYVKRFHYLDDRRYAQNYVDLKKGRKSRMQLRQELYQKGVPKELSESALEDYGPDQERAVISELMRKKHFVPEKATPEEQRKMYGFLIRRGFHMNDVLACLRMELE